MVMTQLRVTAGVIAGTADRRAPHSVDRVPGCRRTGCDVTTSNRCAAPGADDVRRRPARITLVHGVGRRTPVDGRAPAAGRALAASLAESRLNLAAREGVRDGNAGSRWRRRRKDATGAVRRLFVSRRVADETEDVASLVLVASVQDVT